MLDEMASVMREVNSSVQFDARLAPETIQCLGVHVAMLASKELIASDAHKALDDALSKLADSVAKGRFQCNAELEDIHTNIEAVIGEKVGAIAGNVGLARARNDVAVTTLRMWTRTQNLAMVRMLRSLIEVFTSAAECHADTVMPGMTHLQPAQPITWGHLCLAYAEMFYRDLERFTQATERLNDCPLGACALAGTSFAIDRNFTASALGFKSPTRNSIDSVADRDFVLDFLGAAATCSVHISRVAEDLIIWLTPEFGFVSLPDGLVGRSALIPHKRNPDALELIRGKCGRMAGNLHAVQMVLKGLTMSYSRDLQEDKEAIFDSADALSLSLRVLTLIFKNLSVQSEVMLRAANAGYTTSSDLADWLTHTKGIDAASAHELTTRLVRAAAERGVKLSDIPIDVRLAIDLRLGGVDWPRLDALASVESRDSFGGTAPIRVREAARAMRELIATTSNSDN